MDSRKQVVKQTVIQTVKCAECHHVFTQYGSSIDGYAMLPSECPDCDATGFKILKELDEAKQ